MQQQQKKQETFCLYAKLLLLEFMRKYNNINSKRRMKSVSLCTLELNTV